MALAFISTGAALGRRWEVGQQELTCRRRFRNNVAALGRRWEVVQRHLS